MAKVLKTEHFPEGATHGKCRACGLLVVLVEKPILKVWHKEPQCPEFAAMIAELRPSKTGLGVVWTPDDWEAASNG
jgi:hypothetical protein